MIAKQVDKAYSKFIILANARTGSWHLCSLLSSHSKIVCFGEVFHPFSAEFDYDGYKPTRYNKKLRDIDPIRFLKTKIFKDFSRNIKSVGFKLIYYQLDISKFNRLKKYIVSDKEIRIIHLRRRNYLEQFYSLKLAQLTDVWRITGTEKHLTKPLHISRSECLMSFEEFENTEAYISDYFRHHKMIDVFYEDLVQNQDETISSILGFLGLPLEKLQSKYLKQNRYPLKILNYDELKSYFSNTKWSKLFVC